MGLPMYRDTDEVNTHDAAAKPDRSAAARRSAIRRESTVRPNRSPRAQPSTSASSRDDYRERLLRRRRYSLERDQRQIEHLEAELERLRRNRMRSRARADLDTDSLTYTHRMSRYPNGAIDFAELEQNSIAIRELLRRPLRRLARGSDGLGSVATDPPGMIPSQRSISPRRYRASVQPYLPSPPEIDSDHLGNSFTVPRPRQVVDGPLQSISDAARGLPPGMHSTILERARQLADVSEMEGSVAVAHSTDLGTVAEMDRLQRHLRLETESNEEWYASYPPLRRVGHLSPRSLPSPRPTDLTFDGLGDRRRSLSPNSSDSHEEETWTRLTTTMNDEDHPSAQSSFTARSDSAARSSRSSQTAATSFGEIGQLDDTCDLDLPFGITEDDVREIRARHERNEHLAIANDYSTESLVDTMNTQRSGQLSILHSILSRIRTREEVPAEWWAAVGIRPVVLENMASSALAGGTTAESREE